MDLQRIITMMAEKQKEDDQVQRLRAAFFVGARVLGLGKPLYVQRIYVL